MSKKGIIIIKKRFISGTIQGNLHACLLEISQPLQFYS